MAVEDHGLECLKKSAEEVLAGDPSNYTLKTLSGAIRKPWDAVTVAYPSAVQEVYSFRQGGTSGTVVAVATINYTDSTKENLSDFGVTQ